MEGEFNKTRFFSVHFDTMGLEHDSPTYIKTQKIQQINFAAHR